MALPQKKSSSSSSDSSESEKQHPQIITSTYPQQQIYQQMPQQQVIYSQVQGQAFSSLPAGVTEEQVRRSLAGVSLDVIKGEVRQEYIPLTRVETEYKEEVQYEKVPRQVKVTDYYQVEIQEEKIPQVYQHTYTEYIPQQKIIPIVSYRAMEKTYTRPEIMAGDVRVEQGQAEIVSTQIIQGETQNIAAVPLPQIGISGVQVQQQQYISQVPMKRKSSSSSAGKQKIIYQSTQPVQIQSSYHQVAAPVTTQYQQVQAPVQMQTLPPVQMAGRSVTYAQGPAQVGYQSRVVQQPGIVQQGVAPGFVTSGFQPAGIPASNFQGVRLADSHILMK